MTTEIVSRVQTGPASAPPALAATRMARRLTTPFERGADTMDLRLVRFSSSQVTVAYDFADHIARFDVTPEPRYVLALTRDVDLDTTITVDYTEPGDNQPRHLQVSVPAGTLAGTSFLLDQPVTATARVVMVSLEIAPFDNHPEEVLTLTVLLGTLAKLLWVTGAERDLLRRHAVRTLAQRHLPTAVGLSLDLIGADLGVPRFPPLPYGFDAGTVALYHLDDAPGTDSVTDLTAAYPGRTGHPGTPAVVQAGVPGRYGQAMGFRAAGAAVLVASSAEFDIGEFDDATFECFVRPDPAPAAGVDPGAGDGPVLSRRASGGDGPGWAIEIGAFGRGIPRIVRFTISDGDNERVLYANTSLPTDAFTHIAGVLDKTNHRMSLYIDGVLADWRFFMPLDAVANTEPLVIGARDGGFRGIVDEVRISSVPRTVFAPALGEADDHYRRRLELFRRWTLPTPANLQAILNKLVGAIGEPADAPADALVVDDTNATLVRGTRLVRIRPKALLPGTSIDAAGRRETTEATAVGTAEGEDTFDPAFLFTYDRPDVDFTPAPVRTLKTGERAADTHLVQVGVAERLDRLVALAGAETAPPGRLLVDSGYDPRAGDLRATGRAVLLGHSAVAPGKLAALAHRAGFDFVSYRAGAGAAQVYAAAAQGDYFTVNTSLPGQGSIDLNSGSVVGLSLRPAPPADAFVRWSVVPAGPARAIVAGDGGAGTRQHTATLQATAPGRLVVKADVTRGRHTVSATRVLRVGIAALLKDDSIAADGTLHADASVVERPTSGPGSFSERAASAELPPGTFFHPVFLARHDDPRVDYGSADAHLMQPAVGELLDGLLTEFSSRGVGGRLTVRAGYVAGGDPQASQGRKLVLGHSLLAPDALAGIVFAAGFGHVLNNGTDVEARQAPGQLVAVRGPQGLEQAPVIELEEGTSMELTAQPSPGALHDAGLTGQGPDGGPRIGWASGAFDAAAVTLGSSTQQTTTLTAGTAGMAWVQASYLIGGEPVPYTFQVRLRPELDTPATVITKDQHDLIMNILNVLHPVGVEVITSAIRAHVIELRGEALQATNPDYTYPKFRVRGPLPRQVRRPASG